RLLPMTRPPPRPTLFPYTTLFRSKGFPALAASTAVKAGTTGAEFLAYKISPEASSTAASNATARRPFLIMSSRSDQFESCAQHRSEEHTSELQSPYDLVCRLLLEK